jgi:hypothetical protein
MKRLLNILAMVVGVLVLAVGGFLVWPYSPVATFEPVA